VPGADVTVKAGIELPWIVVMNPEHTSGPEFGQSVVMLLLSKSTRSWCILVSPSIRVNEIESPWVTVIVGFAPDGLELFHPKKYA